MKIKLIFQPMIVSRLLDGMSYRDSATVKKDAIRVALHGFPITEVHHVH